MKTKYSRAGVAFFLFAGLLLVSGCTDDKSIDTEYPVIDITVADAFPQQCSSVSRGQAFTFKARFTDNVQLGGYSLDVHQNFDHHSHSTEVNDCDRGEVKVPVTPFLFIRDYAIPAGQREYVADVTIEVPESVDSGDYHFMILLTDKEGWQSIKGLSIKID